jgi:hypothetical protein
VLLACKLLVLMLKIHCWFVASQWKAVSAVVEVTLSSTAVTVPEMILAQFRAVAHQPQPCRILVRVSEDRAARSRSNDLAADDKEVPIILGIDLAVLTD